MGAGEHERDPSAEYRAARRAIIGDGEAHKSGGVHPPAHRHRDLTARASTASAGSRAPGRTTGTPPVARAASSVPSASGQPLRDLPRPVEPAQATADEKPATDKAALFLEARKLAGSAANLDDVLKLAHHLAA